MSNPLFSFGLIADAQYCDRDTGENGQKNYRQSEEKLKKAVEELNKHGLEFTIHLGDFIDWDVKSFDVVNPIYNGLNMQSYHVLGNHDFYVDEEYKDKVHKIMGMDERSYDFKINNFRFIALDGNGLSTHAYSPDDEEYKIGRALLKELEESDAINAKRYNSAVGDDDLNWLKQKLDDSVEAEEKAIIFCHYPVFPLASHVLWNYQEVLDILDDYSNIVAYINGHNHMGAYDQRNNTHYLTIEGMVQINNENAFAIADVYDDRIEIKGYERVPSRVLNF